MYVLAEHNANIGATTLFALVQFYLIDESQIKNIISKSPKKLNNLDPLPAESLFNVSTT
jgi:hypothetical protein